MAIKIVLKPYLIFEETKMFEKVFVNQLAKKLNKNPEEIKELLQGKEVEITPADLRRWTTLKDEIIEKYIEEDLTENLKNLVISAGWKWKPEEPLKGWARVSEKLKYASDVEGIENIEDYFICRKSIRQLSKEERKAVLLSYLHHIHENEGRRSVEIRSGFVAMANTTLSKVRVLEDYLKFSDLIRVVFKNRRWTIELTDLGKEVLRLQDFPDYVLERAPWFVKRLLK